MSKIGIVTVLYNSEQVLSEFFESLEAQTFKDFTLYIIDNASADNSLNEAYRLVRQVSFESVIIPEKENWGVAKGNNIGIRAALADGCDYILLSNNDIVIDRYSIEALYYGINKNSWEMAIPKIYYFGTNKLWCVGGKFNHISGYTKHIGNLEEDTGQYDTDTVTQYAPTCFMLIKNDVFEKVGLMDEKYFVYYDDTDFIYRSGTLGVKLGYVHNSVIHHKVSTCTGQDSAFALMKMEQNGIYFVRKNFTFPYKQISIVFKYLNLHLRKRFILSKPNFNICVKGFWQGLKM